MYGQGKLVLKEGQAVAEYGWLAGNGGLDPCSSPGIKSRYNGMDPCRSPFVSTQKSVIIASFLSFPTDTLKLRNGLLNLALSPKSQGWTKLRQSQPVSWTSLVWLMGFRVILFHYNGESKGREHGKRNGNWGSIGI